MDFLNCLKLLSNFYFYYLLYLIVFMTFLSIYDVYSILNIHQVKLVYGIFLTQFKYRKKLNWLCRTIQLVCTNNFFNFFFFSNILWFMQKYFDIVLKSLFDPSEWTFDYNYSCQNPSHFFFFSFYLFIYLFLDFHLHLFVVSEVFFHLSYPKIDSKWRLWWPFSKGSFTWQKRKWDICFWDT